MIAIETKPLINETLARVVPPDAKYEVRTPLGNMPAPGVMVTASPALNETFPVTVTPFTESWPTVT